jgi:uncharacterized membrane protein YdfJ with MMPL/SSD domain
VAIAAYVSAFPERASNWPPAFVVQNAPAPGASLVAGATAVASQAASAALRDWCAHHKNVVSGVVGYWELMGANLSSLAADRLSQNNRTMLTAVVFAESTTNEAVNAFSADLIKFTAALPTSGGVQTSATGLFPLFSEMQEATASNFALIDAIVLPLATLILGAYVRSYRHMGLALLTFATALLLTFALLVPIAQVKAINQFSPSIMLSLCIAVCFDYTLFMVTRFKEERVGAGRGREDALFEMLLHAGHVVALSGATLFATFVILLFFPQNFLQSVGYGCGMVVLTSMLCNLSLIPALLMACPCLSHFDLLPQRNNCCCRTPAGDPALPALRAAAAAASSTPSPPKPADEGRASPPLLGAASKRSFLFQLSWLSTGRVGAWVVFLAALGISAPFLYFFLRLHPSSDEYLIYLQGSSTLEALKLMKSSFSEGKLDPYQVVVKLRDASQSVFSEAYFQSEAALVARLLATQAPGGYVNEASFTALSFFRGANVSFSQAMAWAAAPPGNSTPLVAAYQAQALSAVSKSRTTALIQVETLVNPNSEAVEGFVRGVRALLSERARVDPSVAGYLFGGYTTSLDVMDLLYALVPTEVGIIVAIVVVAVGSSFGSFMIAVRLVFTIAVSLCWTFGLMTLVYQPGPAQDAFAVITPSILASSGIYWIIPIMSLSILVGLALDYDVRTWSPRAAPALARRLHPPPPIPLPLCPQIFLISRVVEFRTEGWGDRAATCLAVEKSGGIITTAGLIMAVSFVGLLIPKTVVLNQYGFSLFIGVVLDTFVMRPILVPALLTLGGGLGERVNWWPSKMPAPALTEAEEELALRSGAWMPRNRAAGKARLEGLLVRSV